MTSEHMQARIAILRENLAALDRVPQATFEEFMADYRNLDYVLYKLQTSIQVLIDIGSTKLAGLGLGVPSTSREILTGSKLPPTSRRRVAGGCARLSPAPLDAEVDPPTLAASPVFRPGGPHAGSLGAPDQRERERESYSPSG